MLKNIGPSSHPNLDIVHRELCILFCSFMHCEVNILSIYLMLQVPDPHRPVIDDVVVLKQ